ncbi:MAG: acyltransferase [Caulobacterales bacterium]|nr:acyltransferase [Caulobacterales bacterium]
MYPNDIRPLTSLRIVAAVWVLAYHFRDHLGLDVDRLGLIAKGYLGVDLFFILSGFILSHVYLGRFEAKQFNYGSFLWARLSRIYPVHLVTLAATIAIWLVGMKMGATFDPVAFDPAVLPQHLLLIHAWGTTPFVQWNFPSWSISAEWFAYLAFPAAAVLVLAFRRAAWAAVVVALGVFALMFWAVESHGLPLPEVTRLGFIRIIPAFLLGAALYQLGRTVSLPRWLALGGAGAAVGWIVIAASLGLSDAAIWPAFGLLIFSLAEASKTSSRGIMSAAWLVYLGEVSYSVYMTHLPVDIAYFHTLDRLAPGVTGAAAWVAWVGVFVATLLVSMATYHLVERPARNWMRANDPFSRKPQSEPPHEPVI